MLSTMISSLKQLEKTPLNMVKLEQIS